MRKGAAMMVSCSSGTVHQGSVEVLSKVEDATWFSDEFTSESISSDNPDTLVAKAESYFGDHWEYTLKLLSEVYDFLPLLPLTAIDNNVSRAWT